MFPHGLEDPAAFGADLIRSFRSCRTGDMGCPVQLVAADRTALEMSRFIRLNIFVTLMLLFRRFTADRTSQAVPALIQRFAFIIMLRKIQLAHCRSAAGRAGIPDRPRLLAG